MKKHIIFLSSLILLYSLISCNTNADIHEHTYSAAWSSDATSHWHAATCEHSGEISGKENHKWNKGEETTAPVCGNDGVKTYTCTVCKKTKKESIPATGTHDWGDWEETVPATETAEGKKTRKCKNCTAEDTGIIPVLGHSHTIATLWSYNETSHYHAASCGIEAHNEDITAHTCEYAGIIKDADCKNKGTKQFKCSVCDYTKEEDIPVDSSAHIYSEWNISEPATASTNAVRKRVCEVCGDSQTEEVKGSMLHEHSYDSSTLICICGAEKTDLTVEEFINAIGTKVTSITADSTKPKFLKSDDGKSVNAYGFSLSGSFEEKCHFPDSLVSADLTGINTSYITSMSYMFYGCKNLTSLNISKTNTSNVTNMSMMFYECEKLAGLDLGNLVTANVTNMGGMFYYCSTLTELDLSKFNTTNVTNMRNMFTYCSGLSSLDLSSFDTSKVTDMFYMFASCTELTSLDIRNFNTTNVSNSTDIFKACGTETTALKVTYDSDKWKLGTTPTFGGAVNLSWVAVE